MKPNHFWTVVVTASLTLWASADTIYVNGACGNDAWTGLSPTCQAPDGPKRTIQAGIDAARNGDTVLVADGTYTGPGNKNLDFDGRLITVRSENGASNCIIDCEGNGRGFHFHAGETADSLLEGFTITNGNTASAGGGAGILCLDSSPTISTCALSDNDARTNGNGENGEGGAISCVNSSATITGCSIAGNSAEGAGGGVYVRGGSPTITNCTITVNWSESGGGGIWSEDSSVRIRGCTIGQNSSDSIGGAVSLGGGSGSSVVATVTDCVIEANTALSWGGVGVWGQGDFTISRCTIRGNSTTGEAGGIACGANTTISSSTISENAAAVGGGIHTGSRNPIIIDCVIADNLATYYVGSNGGGVYVAGSARLTNCVITGNIAANDGGGIHLRAGRGRAEIVNCTVSRNIAVSIGGGILCESSAVLRSTVLWSNTAGLGGEIALVSGELRIAYCDVQGGEPGMHMGGGALVWGLGNIVRDPLFVDPPADDYRLSPGSPCIDAGDNFAVPAGVTTDLEGNPRFVDDPATPDSGLGFPPIVDMGAYEYQASRCPADLNGDGVVDLADLGILLADFGCTGGNCPGDIDGDGDTDLADLGMLLSQFGRTCP